MVRTLDSHPTAVPWVLGKPFYVVTRPQAQCEVRMDHVAGPLHILSAEQEGRISFDRICLKLYPFERIIWWCLSNLECLGIYFGIFLTICLEICLAGKNIKKIPEDHETSSIVRRVGLHVDFSSMKSSLDL
jgi:hypothetical protein